MLRVVDGLPRLCLSHKLAMTTPPFVITRERSDRGDPEIATFTM